MLQKFLTGGLAVALLYAGVSFAQSSPDPASSTPPVTVTQGAPADAGAPAHPEVAAPAKPAPGTTSPEYIVGPGDTLQVYVWRNPDLTTTVPVRPDGKISTPLVENMVAVGKTPSQLARDMEVVLAKYVRSPQVNIIVTQAASTFSQVKVVGQVGKPSAVAFREGLTVLDLVLEVGGLGPYAAGNRARILRKENGRDTELRVKLKDLLEKGDMRQNITLKPGDVLVVPETFL
jgi:polysaccharide export outer membrane protein